MVTPWVDRYRPVLPKTIHLIQEPYPDHSRSAGPLMGFLRGLALQSSPWVLLLACDLPALHSTPLRLLGRKPDDPTRRNPGLRAPITPGMGTVVRFFTGPRACSL